MIGILHDVSRCRGCLLFLLAIERLRVFALGETGEPERLGGPEVAGRPLALRAARAAVVAGAGLTILLAQGTGRSAEQRAARSAHVPSPGLIIDADDDGTAVRFDHGAHLTRIGGRDACASCHHLCRPGETSSACRDCHCEESAPSPFDHERHAARAAGGRQDAVSRTRTCGDCHGPVAREDVFANPRPCAVCHAPPGVPVCHPDARAAVAFPDAVRERCRCCHERELGQCGFCHQ